MKKDKRKKGNREMKARKEERMKDKKRLKKREDPRTAPMSSNKYLLQSKTFCKAFRNKKKSVKKNHLSIEIP